MLTSPYSPFDMMCVSAASLMGAQSFPNLTTTGTTSTVTMSNSIVTSSNNVATATTGLSVGQLLSNTLTTSLTSTSSESDTGQEAEFSLYGMYSLGCLLLFQSSCSSSKLCHSRRKRLKDSLKTKITIFFS